MRTLTLVLSLCALPALAETPVSPSEFEALFSGKTVTFERSGRAWGREQYFEDRRVIWAFEDGACQRGVWFPNETGQICFAYEDQPDSQCWDVFRDTADRVTVRPDGASPAQNLTATDVTEDFIDCPLPDLGV